MHNSYDRHCRHSSNICHYYRSKGKVCNSSFSSEYSIFLAQFGSMDFPPGVKAPTSTNLKNDSCTPWSYLENLPQRMLWQPHPLFVDLPFFYVPVYEFYAPKDVKKFPWLRPSSQKNQNNAAMLNLLWQTLAMTKMKFWGGSNFLNNLISWKTILTITMLAMVSLRCRWLGFDDAFFFQSLVWNISKILIIVSLSSFLQL